ncbi:hypothetical protein J1N35_034617 [Gossypium stocksii]|uniref:Uncharacterized protein n=1 Tax=Gossypium stocksii TaxID=47602 RepID=A0A9D3USE1_9ROSI|nr:hypothetical protein J1N35_034617 [Gossypium stocksii]
MSRLRDLLLALEDRVVTLKESIENVKERIDDVDDRLMDGLQTMKEQLREYMWDTISSSENKLARKNDALEAMVTVLKEEINELKRELKEINELKREFKIFKAAIGNRMLASKLKQQVMDVPKPKVSKGTRSTDVRRGGIEIGTWEESQKDFKA